MSEGSAGSRLWYVRARPRPRARRSRSSDIPGDVEHCSSTPVHRAQRSVAFRADVAVACLDIRRGQRRATKHCLSQRVRATSRRTFRATSARRDHARRFCQVRPRAAELGIGRVNDHIVNGLANRSIGTRLAVWSCSELIDLVDPLVRAPKSSQGKREADPDHPAAGADELSPRRARRVRPPGRGHDRALVAGARGGSHSTMGGGRSPGGEQRDPAAPRLAPALRFWLRDDPPGPAVHGERPAARRVRQRAASTTSSTGARSASPRPQGSGRTRSCSPGIRRRSSRTTDGATLMPTSILQSSRSANRSLPSGACSTAPTMRC
jgi:hypothetical protein